MARQSEEATGIYRIDAQCIRGQQSRSEDLTEMRLLPQIYEGSDF
jgi:hypothetical protein